MDTNIFFIGNREKKVEDSAWSLCSGLPLSAAGAARLEDKKTHRRRAAESPRGRAQAHQPRTTFSSLLSTLYLPHSCAFVVQICVSCVSCVSWFPYFHLRRRAAESPCGRAQARQPRTAFSSLLPNLYCITNVYGRRGQSVGRVLTRGSFWGHRVRIPPGFSGHHRCYRGT